MAGRGKEQSATKANTSRGELAVLSPLDNYFKVYALTLVP